MHERDTKFSASFDEVFRTEGMDVIRTPIQSPKANAVAERFVGTVPASVRERMLILRLSGGRDVLGGLIHEYEIAA